MLDLTFGEQVKIVLNRRGMTIKELAEMIEDKTGKKMSRQNLTQRLSRDNFQEQDMRLIAEILGCPFQLNIIEEEPSAETAQTASAVEYGGPETFVSEPELEKDEREVTIGEFLDAEALEEAESIEENTAQEETVQAETAQERTAPEEPGQEETAGAEDETIYLQEDDFKDKQYSPTNPEKLEKGELNPYTGREYESNSVRMHPKRIGYVQVYDRDKHEWVDMTEWAFLGYEERKKELLGDNYEPPTYLD